MWMRVCLSVRVCAGRLHAIPIRKSAGSLPINGTNNRHPFISEDTHPSAYTHTHTCTHIWWFVILLLCCARSTVLYTCISVNVCLYTEERRVMWHAVLSPVSNSLAFLFKGHYTVKALIHSLTLCVASPTDDTPTGHTNNPLYSH